MWQEILKIWKTVDAIRGKRALLPHTNSGGPVLCRRFRAELNFEFLIRKKYKFLFQFLYGNPQIIYSNNNITMFAKVTITIHCSNFSYKTVSFDCLTGNPDSILNALIFHLEIQIVHDGVPLVSQT